jgi:mycothiol synthase
MAWEDGMGRLRTFQSQDLDALVAIRNAAGCEETGQSALTADEFAAYWRVAGPASGRKLWVAERGDGQIVGYGGLRPWYHAGWLQAEVVVLPEFRGRGPDDALVERLVRTGERRGASCVGATAPDAPAEAGELLQRHGFEVFVPRLHMRLQPVAVPDAEPVTGFRLRRAGPEEGGALAEVSNAAYADSGRYERADAPGYRRYMEERGVQVWAAERLRPRQVIGLCEVVPRRVLLAEGPAESGHIGSLAVHPDWRERGLGRWLLAAGIRLCLNAGWPTVELNVDRDNAPALALYGSAGFRPVYAFTVYRRMLAPT